MSTTIDVLYIEDNPADTYLVKEELQSASSKKRIQLKSVDRLEKGLEWLASNPVQAILLDLSLPDSVGLDTLQRVISASPHIPVIVMTGQADEEVGIKALQVGAQDYLIKGQVDGHLLTRVIQYAIQRKQTEIQLADTLHFTERILSSSPIGILTYKLTGECTSANAFAAEMIGTPIEELTGQNFHKLESWKKSGLYELAQKAIANKELTTDDIYHIARSGKEVWLRAQFVTFKSAGEELLLLTIGDISERKRMEEALRDSESRYRLATHATKDVIWEWNSKTRQLTWSENAQLVFGYSVEEIGPDEIWWDDRVHPEDRQRVAQRLDEVIAGKESIWSDEYRFLLKDGSYTYISDHGYIERDNSGKAIRMIGAMSNVTERVQAEKALRDSEARYRTLMERSVEAIYLYRIDTKREVAANPTFLALLGYRAEEVNDLTLYDIVAHDRNSIDGYLQQILSEGGISMGERLWRRKDGTTFPVEVTSNKIQQSEGDLIFIVARDITERKQAEEKLRLERARWQGIVEGIADEVWMCDAQGKMGLLNLGAVTAMGLETFKDKSVEEVYQEVDIFYPDGQPRPPEQSPLLRSLRGETVRGEEIMRHRQSGKSRYRQFSSAPTRDADGAITGAVAIVRDVTEEKLAEEGLRRFELISEHSRDIILFIRREDGCILEANAAAVHAYGYSRDELLALTLQDLRAYGFRDLTGQQMAQADAGGILFETVHLRKDGSTFPVEVSSQGATVGGVRVLISIIRDTTERKQAEDSLAQRLSELEAINRISTALRAADSLDEMLSKVLDETLAVIGTEAGTIKLYDPSSDSLVSFASRGWYKDIEDLIIRPGEGTSGTVFSTGDPYLAREFVTDAITIENARSRIPAGWGGACVPIRIGQTITGVLFIAVPLPRELTRSDLNLLTTLAEMTGSAIHRMQLYEETLQQVERLSALQDIDHAISSSFDLRLTLDVVITQVIRLLKIDAADVLLIANDAIRLEYAAGKGFYTHGIRSTSLRLGEGLAGSVAREQHTIQIEDLAEIGNKFIRHDLLAGEGFVSYVGVPLIIKGRIKGVLEVFNRSPLKSDPSSIKFLETLAGQAAIAIDNSILFQDVQRSNIELIVAYDATIEGWVRALDLRHMESDGHTERVTEMTLRLARLMKIKEEKLIHIRRGALLHDIGKMSMPDHILLNTGNLSPDKREIMRRHPQSAYEMLSPISYLREALDIPYCHHENWDGTGYPRGLKGEQIPLAARIFAVVDVWDALTSDRPYRQAWTQSKARKYMLEHSGNRFDPKVVEVFLKNILDTSQEEND